MHLNKFVAACIIAGLSSCQVSLYYQVFNVDSFAELEEKNSSFSYNNDSLTVEYSFWSEFGDYSVHISNHSSKFLYIETPHSFLIINGFAEPLLNSDVPVGTIIIPPKSTKKIGSRPIKVLLYQNCNLNPYPKEDESASISFTYMDSPLTFRSFITYTTSKNSSYKTIDNVFFISSITNHPKEAVYKSISKYDCDNNEYEYLYCTVYDPLSFFIEYYDNSKKHKKRVF